jgi:hypothetical protein
MIPLKNGWQSALVGLLALAFLLLLISPVLNPPKWDEYVVAYDAHRLIIGEVPYRDFFNFIPPGAFIALAWLFKAAGASTLTLARYFSLVVVLASFVLASLALRRRGWGPWSSALWAAVLPVVLYPFWAVASHHWFADACAVLLLALLAREEPRRWPVWAGAGAAAGAGGLFLQPAGVALLLLSGVLLLQQKKRKAESAAAWAAGCLAVWVPVLLWLGFEGALGGFVSDAVIWPSKNYARSGNENAGAILQDLPWRLQDLWTRFHGHPRMAEGVAALAGWLVYGLLVALALGLLCLSAVLLWRSLRGRSFSNGWVPAFVLLVFLQFGLALRGSPNWLHLVFLLEPLILLGLMAVGDWGAWRRPWRIGTRLFLAALLISGLLYHARGLMWHRPAGWELADVDRVIRDQPVNRFLRTAGVVGPNDAVAAFPEGGEVYLYGPRAAVGYTYFTPLSQGYNTLEDHKKMAEELERNRPKWILVTKDLEHAYLDPRSPVAKIILGDYSRQGVIGEAVLYRRKGS